MAQIQSPTTSTGVEVETTSKAMRALLYDPSGNPIILKDRATVSANQGYLLIAGLDGGQIVRSIRVGETGTQRVTSEVIQFHDAFEGSTINTWAWTQSNTTMTQVQASGVLTLNNSAITTLNTSSILTSTKQFAKYPRQPLFCRFRGRITANVAGNHTLIEIGYGAPSGVTAIIQNGAFFRWRADGTLAIVISYGGVETITQVLAQGVLTINNYYYYDIIIDDDFVRFIVSDAGGAPVVDTQTSISVTSAYLSVVSHLPVFTRVYVDATGGGTAVQFLLSAASVYMQDVVHNKPWEQQIAGVGRHASINPTTYVSTPNLVNAAVPTSQTPSNTAAAYTTCGGGYAAIATAASENILSVFGFTIPSPYSFYLRGLQISLPVVQGAAVVTTPLLEWFIAPNASSTNLSTATGLQRIALPGWMTTAATAAIGSIFTGTAINFQPSTPIVCLPGTILHIGYKSVAGAATASLVYRGQVYVDGFFQ